METTNKLPNIYSDPSPLSANRRLLIPVIFQVPYRTHCLNGAIIKPHNLCTVLYIIYVV